MCVGCSRGFEIVDLESLDTQGLLDPDDESLEFVRKRENLRPMAIYRILNEFLLCYDGELFFICFCWVLAYLFFLKNLPFMLIRMVVGHGRSLWCIGRACQPVLVGFSYTGDFLYAKFASPARTICDCRRAIIC